MELVIMAKTAIRRHRICLDKNPYLSENYPYYQKRAQKEIQTLLRSTPTKLVYGLRSTPSYGWGTAWKNSSKITRKTGRIM